jgi:hypothetical protein
MNARVTTSLARCAHKASRSHPILAGADILREIYASLARAGAGKTDDRLPGGHDLPGFGEGFDDGTIGIG